MASKSAQQEPEKAEVIEELLDALDTALDRVKVLYEQYFLGIQKQPPTFIHTDVERKLRDLAQLQIRNTALRYRFVTLQQKFGSYNSYWRRTLRQIENGTYHRNLHKIGRKAIQTGDEIPEEIFAAMPKRMREQVRRDREAAIAIARRRDHAAVPDEELLTLVPEDDETGFVRETTDVRLQALRAGNEAHVIEDPGGDFEYEELVASIQRDQVATPPRPLPVVARAPTPPPVRAPTSPGREPVPWSVTKAIHAALDEEDAAEESAPTQVFGPSPAAPQARPAPPPPRPASGQPTGAARALPKIPLAPSQVARPLPIVPGSSLAQPAVPVDTLAGPFAREPALATAAPPEKPALAPAAPPSTPPEKPAPAADEGRPSIRFTTPKSTPAVAKPAPAKPAVPRPAPAKPPAPRRPPPPGMTDDEVKDLYTRYVQAKQQVGEIPGPAAYGKLLKTISDQAPKIMEQYKAKGVAFSVVVKDNQVIIRAKPKT